MFEKSLLAIAGIAIVGVVGYKIIKKQNPKLLKDIGHSFSNIGDSTAKVLEGAAQSFKEGYASAA
ncbi:MAG: hypothetical protein HQL23_08025 [Candidatus Omnitrophica bacterium]|nr:hypothetical protein [Candidatus Omnitrophota bacterium]